MIQYKHWFFVLLTINIIAVLTVCILLWGTERGYFFKKRIDALPYGRHHRKEIEMHNLYNHHNNDSTIVMLGNSITYECNWSELLAMPNVVNRGIPGETIEGIINRLPTILASQPKTVVLMAGINNLLNGDHPNEILPKYTQLLDTLRLQTKLIVCATLYTSIYKELHSDVNVLNDFLAGYCQQNQLTFIDLNSTLTDANNILERQYTYDGLHLNSKGYDVWRSQLLPHLQNSNR